VADMLGIGGLLLNVTGDSLSQARVGRIDVDSWALTVFMVSGEAKRYDLNNEMVGMYMSINQEPPPIPIGRRIVMIRRHETWTEEQRTTFMKGDIDNNIISANDIDQNLDKIVSQL
jgi:hypothetical protein